MIWIIGYALSVAVAYAVARIFITEMDSDFGSILLAWIVAAVWPAFAAFMIAFAPLMLVSKLIDSLITRIMDRVQRRK